MRIAILTACTVAILNGGLLSAQPRREAENSSIELALSDQTVQLRYRTPTRVGGQQNSEIAYGVFLSEDRDTVVSAALLMGADLNLGPLSIQFGPQAHAVLLSEENNDVFALSIGAQLRYELIPSRGIALEGSAFYSPDVLTFGSADKLTDFMARAEIRLTDRIVGFAGYRWFELDLLMRQEQSLQNELFAGVQWELR